MIFISKEIIVLQKICHVTHNFIESTIRICSFYIKCSVSSLLSSTIAYSIPDRDHHLLWNLVLSQIIHTEIRWIYTTVGNNWVHMLKQPIWKEAWYDWTKYLLNLKCGTVWFMKVHKLPRIKKIYSMSRTWWSQT